MAEVERGVDPFFETIKPEVATLPPDVADGQPLTFRYTGMGLPWKNTVHSYFYPKNDQDIIRSSIFWILSTRIGERPMLPSFGSLLPDLVHEQNDAATAVLLRFYTAQALRTWEPRIRVTDVQVTSVENRMTISIAYIIVADPNQALQTFDLTVKGG